MTNKNWINRDEYSFKSNFYKTPVGNMHYIDEGLGNPIVFVHGNPSWSYEFRHLIKALSRSHRCIAIDHIGFGLSDKPYEWSYSPKNQAGNLEDFLLSLELDNITLVVGDWGGPIGLAFAIKYPEKVKNIVITNTWLWSVKNDLYYQAFSMFTGGPIGKLLIQKRNFFARDILKATFGDKSKLTQEVHKHYLMPLAIPKERKGNWVFPKEIIGSSEWLEQLWYQVDVLKNKNILIAWGMKDIAFREKELNCWMRVFPEAKVVRYLDTGHFVAEEKAKELALEIELLLKKV